VLVNEFKSVRAEVGGRCENSFRCLLVDLYTIEFAYYSNTDFMIRVISLTLNQIPRANLSLFHGHDIPAAVSGSLSQFNLIAKSVPDFSDEFFKLTRTELKQHLGLLCGALSDNPLEVQRDDNYFGAE